MTKVEERQRTEALKLAETLYRNVDEDLFDMTEINFLATALAEAEARGAREEREAAIAIALDSAKDAQPDSEYALACNDLIELIETAAIRSRKSADDPL